MLLAVFISMFYLASLCFRFFKDFFDNPLMIWNLGLAFLFCSSMIASLFACIQKGQRKFYFGLLAITSMVLACIIMVGFMPRSELISWGALLGVPLVSLIAESLGQVTR